MCDANRHTLTGMRRLSLVFACALVVAACGTEAEQSGTDSGVPAETTSTTAPDQPAATTSSTAANGSASSSTSSTSSTSLPPLDGPAAPDFALELSDGSTFMLSEETRPVYLIFWAEW